MADIIICDDFVSETGSYLNTETEKIETVLNTYLNIMQRVSDTGIMEGDTAEALKTFIETAMEMKGNFSNMGQCTDEACKNFLSKIDDADQYLY